MSTDTKVCTKCHIPKPLKRFSWQRKGKRRTVCIDCRGADQRAIALGHISKKARREAAGRAPRVGICELCTTTALLVSDHDHATGQLRGMICSNCNTGIGLLWDNVDILANAIKYLYKYSA